MKIDREALLSILHNHQLWIRTDGQSGEQADLSGAVLTGMNLIRADLIRADLRRADLRRANLRGVNLRGAWIRISSATLWYQWLEQIQE